MINKFYKEFLKNNLLWSEGRRDLLISILNIFLLLPLALLPKLKHDPLNSYLIIKLLLFLAFVFWGFLLFFYRNPKRALANDLAGDDSLIISPADGKVILIEQTEKGHKVSIFLSPLNVHVNWIPINGIIESINYKPGKFLMAFKSESSELNERNDIVVTNTYGTVKCRQIAGLLARRIACWVDIGRRVHLNEKYGMIKFGSRIDLFLPDNVKLNIHLGEKVIGGLTIIGKFAP